MPVKDPGGQLRECVACKRCYPAGHQLCRDCMIELVTLEYIPFVIDERYRLERELSRGGTGFIFLAHDLQSRRDVAVKVIRASVIADPRARDRFEREAELALNFKHAQSAEVFGFGMLPTASAYVVAEFVHGRSLRQEMKRVGKFGLERGTAVIGEIAAALDAAHCAGLLHRDLKPESVILPASSELQPPAVKLVGFGFGKISTGHEHVPGTTVRLQGLGQLPLRPTYLSPEQYRGAEAGPQSDIYSLGVIAYEMLAGQPPFTARRVTDFGLKLLNARPQSLQTLNPEVNVMIEAEILRALEKEPLDRHQRAAEFKRALLNGVYLR